VSEEAKHCSVKRFSVLIRYQLLLDTLPFSFDIQHLSCDVCLEVRGRLSELFCVVLCTEAVHSHKQT